MSNEESFAPGPLVFNTVKVHSVSPHKFADRMFCAIFKDQTPQNQASQYHKIPYLYIIEEVKTLHLYISTRFLFVFYFLFSQFIVHYID